MWLTDLLIGLTIGFSFGYILQRTGITKYPRVTGMLLLKDFKILKFMMTAVISSMIIFHVLGDFGVIKLGFKPLDWGKLYGGLIFGVGMALLGACPGTLMARIGEGKKEALIAAVGMITGILIFAFFITPIQKSFLQNEIPGDLSMLLGINHWLIIIPLSAVFSGIIYLLNKKFNDNTNNF